MWIKMIIHSNIFCSMEKQRQIKLQCLQKVQIWAFGFWYIKSTHYKRFLNWNQISPKNEVVTGKSPFSAIDPLR